MLSVGALAVIQIDHSVVLFEKLWRVDVHKTKRDNYAAHSKAIRTRTVRCLRVRLRCNWHVSIQHLPIGSRQTRQGVDDLKAGGRGRNYSSRSSRTTILQSLVG